METATGITTETLESKESISKPAFYVCFEGPASSGKSAIIASLPIGLSYLLETAPFALPIHNLVEPPDWQAFADAGLPTPYKMIRRQMLADNYAQILALTAWRRMMWGGAVLDGKPIDPGLYEILQHPQGIVVGDRSPMSMGPYQNVFPGSTFPEAAGIFPLLYSFERIPFPDLLYVIMPEPDAQRRRLEARLEVASGKLDDFGDDPKIQDDILTGYDKFLTVIRNWPGVYKLNSQEVLSSRNLNISTAICMHIYITLLEKGIYNWGKFSAYQPKFQTRPFRIELNTTDVTAYMFKNLFEAGTESAALFTITHEFAEELYSSNKGQVVVNYGDILLLFNRGRTTLITLENPDVVTAEEAIQMVLAASMKDNSRCLIPSPPSWLNPNHGYRIAKTHCMVTERNHYGTDLYGRYKCDRSWGNITW